VFLLKKFIHNLYIKKIIWPSFTLQATQSGPTKALGTILYLELDMEVFMKVLELLVEVATPKVDTKHVHSFDIDFLVKKRSRRFLNYE